MDKRVARVGDEVVIFSCGNPNNVCGSGCNHGPQKGKITTGAQLGNLRPIARQYDTGMTQCPHPQVFIIQGSSKKVRVDGQLVARLGDRVQCMGCLSYGRITTASPDISCGD